MYLAPEPRRGPPGLNVCEPRASVVSIARSNADEGSAEPLPQWRRQNPGSKVADETRGLPGVVGQAGREGGLEKDGRPAKVSGRGRQCPKVPLVGETATITAIPEGRSEAFAGVGEVRTSEESPAMGEEQRGLTSEKRREERETLGVAERRNT